MKQPYRIGQLRRAQSVLFATFLLGGAGAAAGTPEAHAIDRARVEPAIELEYRVQGTGNRWFCCTPACSRSGSSPC